MASEPDWKPEPRIVDSSASKRKLLADAACRACGARATNCHHLLGKGQRGDDVVDALIPLCGHGSAGCHGALHGNTYVVVLTPSTPVLERRDARWVRSRVGLRLRPSEYAYLVEKLTEARAAEHLRRLYHVELVALHPFILKEVA